MTLAQEIARFNDRITSDFTTIRNMLMLSGVKSKPAIPFYGNYTVVFDRNEVSRVISVLEKCGFAIVEQNNELIALSKKGNGLINVHINYEAPVEAGDECRLEMVSGLLESYCPTLPAKYIVEHLNTESAFNKTLRLVKKDCQKVCENLYTYEESGAILYISVFPDQNRILVDTRPRPPHKENDDEITIY